ncbi:MAG: type III-B CRISPR-associated protein Cas10/Cmr2 [Anaerolineae bacterium]
MPYLFQCAIGPVQDFIATARKSRDLWYGSWMLSELAKAAAKAIADAGGQLIFPFTADTANDLAPKSKFNAPNKIVGVISGVPSTMAIAVDTAIRTCLHELRDNAFKTPLTHPYFDGTLATKQVDDLVEFYWVSVAFVGDIGYAQARRTAETLLNARKATRDFRRFDGDYKPKSSLDGIRESVIDERAYAAPGDTEKEKKRKAKILFDRFRARPAERLSGVDILKRWGNRKNEPDFRSTSHMAALPFLGHVDKNQITGDQQSLLNEIKALLAGQDVVREEDDGALVFSSRLAEWVPDRDERDAIARQMDAVLEKYAGQLRPQPYYALLAADGDNMGAAIDYLTTQPHPQDEHRKLSVALSRFAREVEKIVKNHQGVLIYSGGDDVLAYLPLHRVLDCANSLAVAFAEQMQNFKTEEGKSPTLSAGVVVAHHLEPLSDALELARDAERKAKTVDGKHGLAITVSKRSGVDRTIKGKRGELMERLDTMICWRRAEVISAGTPYEMQNLHQVMGSVASLKEAMIKETLRIVERKRESGGEQIDKKKQEKILAEFKKWLEVEKVSLVEIAHEMIIANEFASAMDMAGVPKKECFKDEDLAD